MNNLLKILLSLFVAMNVVGILPIFLSLTANFTPSEKKKTMAEGIVTAFSVSTIFVFFGKWLFQILGIEVADFMIACGLILLVISIMMFTDTLYAKPGLSKKISVVPLGTPLLAGPGFLTTSLILTAMYGYAFTVLGIFLVSMMTLIILYFADRINHLIGEEGIKGISKIASLFLAGIGVMIIRKGLDFLIR